MPDPMIDAAQLDELLDTVGGDRAFLAELVETYMTDSPALFAELRAAAAAGDAATARRAAHSLKSTSANFGATSLAAQCREIELAAADGRLAGMESAIDAAEATYAAVASALQAAIDGSGA